MSSDWSGSMGGRILSSEPCSTVRPQEHHKLVKTKKNPILLTKRMVMTTTMSNYAQS